MAKVKTAAPLDTLSEYDYKTTKVVDKKGKTVRSTGNGDAVQLAMLAFKASGKDIGQVVRANKLNADHYNPKKWDNIGLMRMSIGNKLRGMVRNGTPVVIGDVTVKTLAQRVALEAAAPAKKARASRKAKAPSEVAQAA